MEVLNFTYIKKFKERHRDTKHKANIKTALLLAYRLHNIGTAEVQYIIDHYELELTKGEKELFR